MALLWVMTLFGPHVPASYAAQLQDTLRRELRPRLSDSLNADTISIDSLLIDTLDTLPKKQKPLLRDVKNFLDKPISGTNKDSLVYDLRENMVYIYEQGDISYDDMNMQADFMRVNMETKDIHAYGKEIADTAGTKSITRPKFIQAESEYDMDTVTYNIGSGKAKVKGVTTQNGEGFIIGKNVKLMPDKSINIKNGIYTTCDAEEPHFGIRLTQGKMIPGKKIITGPAYLEFEGVPFYFLAIPEGFFPINSTKQSGFIVPSYGEESAKGFYLRDAGYYFILNDYMDLTLLGGIYSLGSWEASAATRYTKRYKYNGNFSLRFSNDKLGEKGSPGYVNQRNFRVTWSHVQDPKFKPSSTFSASVNFSTSGYNKNASTTLSDYLSTQTNSSIAYSKTWPGTPFSLSMNLQHSQNSADSTISLSLPNVVFNASRFYPFKRKNAVGTARWYEKISASYSMNMQNSVSTKESLLFRRETLKEFRNGIRHSLPVSASFNILNNIQFTASANYNERWYFKRVDREWDDTLQQAVADTTFGFYRVYNYSTSASLSTTLYGLYQFKSKNSKVQAIRHTMTPSVSMSWAPDFSTNRYGFYKTFVNPETGQETRYSPYAGEIYGVPGSGRTAAMSFSLAQTLEMKVKSENDTTGTKKISVIDNLQLSGSYNFLADSMKMSMISVSLRSSVFGKNFGINISTTLDPYEVDPKTGVRYDKLTWERGNLGRITHLGWSTGYTWRSTSSNQATINDINSQYPEYSNPYYFDPDNPIPPDVRRQMMTAKYYDFSIPWNFGFNYSVNYSNNGLKKTITNSLGFNGSITLTQKMGVTFTGGYDFDDSKLTPGTVSLSRDLHCWQMSFTCVPFGYRKSWSFNISALSTMLQDLKYEKNSSFYDNLYE